VTSETLLFRQVNPSWVQAGRVTSQVFKPTSKDRGNLSVYDGDQLTAEDAWKHYTEQLEYASVGVLAVTVRECEMLDLAAEADPKPFPAHIVIRFGDLARAEIERKAKRLKSVAVSRGWLYQAEAAA
jgi:hypothetical protein